MGDLISRSALISRFKQLQGSDTLANMFVSDVIREVKNQPTAYNVEIVVKNLKEMYEYCGSNNCEICRYGKKCEPELVYEIVTAGGVNE